MNIREYMQDNILILDGGMGTILQAHGLKPGEQPEMWNLEHPDVITGVHRDYYEAGSNVVNTNTFGANILHYDEETLDKIVRAAVQNARRAAAEARTCNLDKSGNEDSGMKCSLRECRSAGIPKTSGSWTRTHRPKTRRHWRQAGRGNGRPARAALRR